MIKHFFLGTRVIIVGTRGSETSMAISMVLYEKDEKNFSFLIYDSIRVMYLFIWNLEKYISIYYLIGTV